MTLTRWIGFLGMWLVVSLPVMAQQAVAIPNAPAPDSQWMGLTIAIVLIIGVVVASFMTPKRDHRD